MGAWTSKAQHPVHSSVVSKMSHSALDDLEPVMSSLFWAASQRQAGEKRRHPPELRGGRLRLGKGIDEFPRSRLASTGLQKGDAI